MANLLESLLVGGVEVGAGILLGGAGAAATDMLAASFETAAGTALVKLGLLQDIGALASVFSRPALQHQNREQMVASSIANLPVVYGKARLGCHLIHATTTAQNAWLWYVGGICEGEIAGFDEIYVDGNLAVDAAGVVRPNQPAIVTVSSYLADSFLLHVTTSGAHGLVAGDDLDAYYGALTPQAGGKINSWVVYSVDPADPTKFTLPLYADPAVANPGKALIGIRRNTPGYATFFGFAKYLGGLDQDQHLRCWQDGKDDHAHNLYVAGGSGTDQNMRDSVLEWPATAIGKGVAYLVLLMKYDANRFRASIPQVTVNVRGKKVYDPRSAVAITSSSVANPTVLTTGTAHGRETGDLIRILGHSGGTPSLNGCVYRVTKINATQLSIPVNVTVGGTGGTLGVVGYSANPALCQRDYLTNQWYGPGTPDAMIDDSNVAGGVAGEATMCGDGADNLTGATVSRPQWVPADTGQLAVVGVDTSTEKVNVTSHGFVAGTDVYFLATTTTPSILGRQRVIATGLDANHFELDAGVQAGGAPSGAAVNFTVGGAQPATATVEAARQQETFRCDGIVDTSRGVRGNMETLLTASRAQLCYWGGKFHFFTRRAVSPTSFALTADNVTAGTIRTTIPGAAKSPNVLRATFIDGNANLQSNSFLYPPIDSANPYLIADNGIRVEKAIELPFTNDRHMCEQLCQVILKEMRSGKMVALTAKEAALGLTCMDAVPLTYDTPGWSAKTFWVRQLRILPRPVVGLQLQEYDATAYTYDLVPGRMRPPDTSLPSPWKVPDPPTGLILSTGSSDSRIRATWSPSLDARVDRYQVWAKRTLCGDQSIAPDSDWCDYGAISAQASSFYIGPVIQGDQWSVEVRSLTVLGVPSDLDTDDPWQCTASCTVSLIVSPGYALNAFADGANISYQILFEDRCDKVELYTVQNSALGNFAPDLTLPPYAVARRSMGNEVWITIPTTAAWTRYTILVPCTADGAQGTASAVIATGNSNPFATPATPTALALVTAHPTSLDISWTSSSTAGTMTRIWVNGVIVATRATPGISTGYTFTIPDPDFFIPPYPRAFTPNQDYFVVVDCIVAGKPSALSTIVKMTTASTVAGPATFLLGPSVTYQDRSGRTWISYALTWDNVGAWEVWIAAVAHGASAPGVGSASMYAIGPVGTTFPLAGFVPSSPAIDYYLWVRGAAPRTSFTALDANPVYTGAFS